MIQKERLLKEFLEFVQIGSESGNEKAMGEKLVEVLRGLGLEVITDHAGETFGSNGFNVFARLPGTLDSEPLMMSAHMDTVVPGNGIQPYVKDGVIYSGCYCNFSLAAAGFDYKNKSGASIKKGVTVYLDGVQFVKDGERFGADDASSDFDELDDDNANGGEYDDLL